MPSGLPPTPSASAPSFPDLLPVFNAQPGATLLLSPDWVIAGASDDYLAATLTERATLVGQYIFDAFPDNPDTPEANGVANVRASLQQVMATKEPHEMAPQHYDVPDPAQPGRFVERHWKPRHTPVLDAQRQVQFIIQSVQDITASRLAERQLLDSQAREQAARAEAERQRGELQRVFEQAPVAIAVYRGPRYVIELANATVCRLWGRTAAQIIGKGLFEALPEVAGMGYEELLDGVMATGVPHVALAMEAQHDRNGQRETVYWDFVYVPLSEADGRISGVMVVATEATAQVRARQQVEELNHDLEARVQERTAEALAARAEAEAQQDELQRVFEQAPVSIAIFRGPTLVVELANAAQGVLWGRAVAPVLGRPLFEALPDLAGQGLEEIFARVLETGEPYHVHELCCRIDRAASGKPEEGYFTFTYQPLRDGQGRVTGLLPVGVEVTEQVLARRQAEALQAQLLAAVQHRAQEREAFYQVFEQTAAIVALLRGPAHRYEFVNPAYQSCLPGRQLVGRDLAEAAPELLEQGFAALLDRVYETGETFFGNELLFTAVPAPGQPARSAYFNFTYQAYREDGAIVGVSVFAYDVTEQVRAREQREAQRERLQRLFMEAPAAICILDGPDLVYELVNPGYQALFPGRELLGRPILQALPEIAEHAVAQTFRRVFETGDTHEEAAILIPIARLTDGALEERYFNYIQQARRNEHGQVDGVLVFAFEVTEQVVAREQAQSLAAELSTTNQQLVRTNVDLDNFVYTASHDLKAPISNLEGLLQLLQIELPPAVAEGPAVAPVLGHVSDAVDRFKRTIDHLTEVSKLQKEHAPATDAVDLAAVVEGVRRDLTPLLRDANAELTVAVSNFPPILFSEKNLRSVVYNLLSNALKYRHPDRRPHVDIRAHVRPNFTVLEVHDNGLGIDAQHLPRLFTMFQRFHDHVEGTGIGLFMLKRMVDNAGGRVEVHSQLDAGTTFFVHLPHAAVPAA